ncbi:MAG: PIN domain nuclease, partial [Actinomycetota bacterium]|nr:PIN domain nuclease [Actinomycetota bacterium]
VYRTARLSGRTVRSLVDCLIAVVAARTGTVVVHRDRDFDVLAQSLPDLRVRSL